MAQTHSKETSTFEERPLAPGMRLLVAPTPKFKRTRVMLFAHDRLSPDRAALGALLPYVQKRGTAKYPTGRELERAAGMLYEAELSGGVHKVGDRQLIAYSIDMVADAYVERPIFREGLELLHEMVYNPAMPEGAFDPDYVEQEKRFQVGRLKALVNNKIAYAQFRCIEEMFKGEPFGQHQLGSEEAILDATPQKLATHHQELLETRPIDVYVVGDVDVDAVHEGVSSVFQGRRRAVEAIPPTQVGTGEGDVRYVTQEERMKQGWLVLGLRTDLRRCDAQRYAMMMFNGILGGFVHSKLFTNVREKASLAYAASSSYDSNKGVVLAMAGIDVNKYDQALEIMKVQIEDTMAGRFTDEELEATRRALLTQYRMRLDTANGRILFHVGGTAEGCPDSVEEAIQAITDVSREDVLAAAERIRLDMVYFLKGTN